VNLCGANLTHANLRGADLTHADLRGANLRGANLRGAVLTRANLCDCCFHGARISYRGTVVRIQFIDVATGRVVADATETTEPEK
jgi:uncharacterized protein YjbI with pentapeptide repeats